MVNNRIQSLRAAQFVPAVRARPDFARAPNIVVRRAVVVNAAHDKQRPFVRRHGKTAPARKRRVVFVPSQTPVRRPQHPALQNAVFKITPGDDKRAVDMRGAVMNQSHVRHNRRRYPQTQSVARGDINRRLRVNIRFARKRLPAEQKHFALRLRRAHEKSQMQCRRRAREVGSNQARRYRTGVGKPRLTRQRQHRAFAFNFHCEESARRMQ